MKKHSDNAQPTYTRGEWKVINDYEGKEDNFVVKIVSDKKTICILNNHPLEITANAQRIVKAVNMHDELISKLKALLHYVEDNYNVRGDNILDIVKETLKEAEQQ